MPDQETYSGEEHSSEAQRNLISRRTLLKRWGIVGGAALTPVGLFGLEKWLQHERTEAAANKLAAESAALREHYAEVEDQFVKEGMAGQWKVASVWPGIAIMSPKVKLYDKATLAKGSEIKWPTKDENDHLTVQRPFMLAETFISQGWQQAPDDIGYGVMGFWMPDSEQMAFCDQQAFSDEIVLPTNSNEPIYYGDANYGIYGEKVHLDPALQRDGLTWRYLTVTDRSAFEPSSSSEVTKVVGRSAWTDMDQTARAFTAYMNNTGPDLIELPGVQ